MRSARQKSNKMAIYHLTAKTVSRGGASAKARHDYIKREGRYQADRKEVISSQSGNMPEWAKGCPGAYWDSADVYERGNGRLFKQLEFALPRELSTEQQQNLVQKFVSKITSTKDGPLPYSYAIHKGHNKENPHCHLMISERANDGYSRTAETWFKRANSKVPEKGGAKKTEELKPKEWLQEIRKDWSQQANNILELAGYQSRIDHRSLEAQGISREPTQHLGPVVSALEAKGIQTRRVRDFAKYDDNIDKIISELEAAKAQKIVIITGMSDARKLFQVEKKRLQRRIEREQKEIELDQKNRELIELEYKKQIELENNRQFEKEQAVMEFDQMGCEHTDFQEKSELEIQEDLEQEEQKIDRIRGGMGR